MVLFLIYFLWYLLDEKVELNAIPFVKDDVACLHGMCVCSGKELIHTHTHTHTHTSVFFMLKKKKAFFCLKPWIEPNLDSEQV